MYGIFAIHDNLRQQENQNLVVSPEMAKTLPYEVLTRLGWTRHAGGAGSYELTEPVTSYLGIKEVFFILGIAVPLANSMRPQIEQSKNTFSLGLKPGLQAKNIAQH